MLLVGVASHVGRSLSVRMALSGQQIIVVDEDLTAADALVEWLVSVGASAQVEALRFTAGLVAELCPRLAAVVDTRATEGANEVSIQQLAAASTAKLPTGSWYARTNEGATDGRMRDQFEESMLEAERRGVGFLLVESCKVFDESAIETVVDLMRRVSDGRAPTTMLVEIR